MNATSTINAVNASNQNSAGGIRAIFRTIRAELRRALDLHVQNYAQGIVPPM